MNIDPQETIYLNQYHEVVDNFRVGSSGNKILPWGSPRDVFLAVEPKKLDEVFDFLTKVLQDKAVVMKTEEALAEGLFGRGSLHKKFLSRIGNILILPCGNSTVWYEHFEGKKIDLLGMHGGLSPEEVLIPFAVIKGSQLV